MERYSLHHAVQHGQRVLAIVTRAMTHAVSVMMLLATWGLRAECADVEATLPPAPDASIDFVQQIQPILSARCYECHSGDQPEGGLNLAGRREARDGGDDGPVIVAGKSAESRLVERVTAKDDNLRMPPDGPPLSASDVGLLRAWIDQGADWPDDANGVDPRWQQAQSHWAFQRLRDVPLPEVEDTAWSRTPIDRFVLARLEAFGSRPHFRATPRQIVRRMTFDLIGLPPTPEEVHAFGAAAQRNFDAALTSLVDRLLPSPLYGERWARHWLDVARYADSDGQESDRDRLLAYHYRDFVIRAFNDDLPFDRFVRWQLAGDEYEPDNPQAVAATGFLAAGPTAELPDDLLEDERLRNLYNELDDIVSTVGTAFLGLTLGCARCHDHKYDAIPARDYYRMLSAFHSGERGEVPLGSTGAKAFGYRDFGPEPKPTWLFRRADFYDREQPVTLGFVSMLTADKSAEKYWSDARTHSRVQESTLQRRAVAEWMTDVEQGAGALLARVIVNRLWQHHFGYGLVRTVGDFGVRSEPPTHPDLLEWLAHDLVRHGWQIKRLQRMMVLSAVYLQSSAISGSAADSDNRLLGRMPLRRLEAETLRDTLLAVSGSLNRTAFGPAVKAPIASEAMLARNLKDPYPDDIEDGPAVRRRSIYLFHKRVVPNPLLQAFDKPDAQQSCNRRDRTTVAPQALVLLNDPFVRRCALDFADRLLASGGHEPQRWIELAFQLALSRPPTDAEQTAAVEFVESQFEQRSERSTQAGEAELRRQALADFCQVIFSLNEFIYVD